MYENVEHTEFVFGATWMLVEGSMILSIFLHLMACFYFPDVFSPVQRSRPSH